MRIDPTIHEKIEKIIQSIIAKDSDAATNKGSKHFMENWDWYQGVALFGLYRYYQESQDATVLNYLIEWFDSHLAKGQPVKNINSMCPLLTLSYLYEQTGREDYLAVCQEWVDFAMNDLPRTREGGFQHITIDSDNYMQLWDDTLYMTVLFVGRMGTLTGCDAYIQESIRQFLVHLKYLTDTSTGLFFHGYNFDGRHHFGKALWGRGNAWYTAGLVDYLDMIAVPKGVRDFLLSSLEMQVEALASYQTDAGMWHTLINDPSSYLESSATAGFAYGILKAVRKGYLPEKYAENGLKALDAICQRITAKGVLTEVSGGTCVSDSLDYYRSIPICTPPYGQSMALLLLMEALHWEQ